MALPPRGRPTGSSIISWLALACLGVTLLATRLRTWSPAALLPIMPGCATSCVAACGLSPPAWLLAGDMSCSTATTCVLLGTSHRGRLGAGTCRSTSH